MKILALLTLMLCGCERARTPEYFLSQTIERPDGTIITRTYSGAVPPEKLFDIAEPN